MEENKKNKKDYVSIALLLMSIMILGSIVYYLLSSIIMWDNAMHENRMEELELKKEIALIGNQNNVSMNILGLDKIIEYERNMKQLEIRSALCEYTLYETYGHNLNG